ncbi:hypothetical protein MTO96_021513 [Rhipicephalus appendiculatus]
MKAWQWDPFLHRVNASTGKKDNVNAQCRDDVRRFVDAMVHRQVAGLQLLDSQGSIPTGILHGALSDMGSLKECFAAGILDEKGNVVAKEVLRVLCLQHGSAAQLSGDRRERALSEWKLSTFVSACDYNVPPDQPSVFVILVLAAFVTAVVLATVIDVLQRRKLAVVDQAAADADSDPVPASGRRVPRSASKPAPAAKGTRLDVFNGLRVIGLVWVIAIHSYIYMDDALIDNSDEVYEMSRTLGRQFIVNATMSVAIFTTVSGFMLWMAVSKRSADEHGRTSWLAMVLHRYLRLFPLVIVTSCFHHFVPVSGYGPLWATFGEMRKRAFPENWPFYVTGMLNYLDLDKICSPQHWYTGMDFQVFAITLYFAYRLKRQAFSLSCFDNNTTVKLVLKRGGFLTDVLAWPGWAPISRLSYSIYIIHDFMLYYQWVAFPSRVNGGYYFMMTVVAGNCVGSFAMAFVLHAFFERPLNLMATLLEERCLPGRRTVARDALAASEQENGVVIPKKATTVRGRNDRTKRL